MMRFRPGPCGARRGPWIGASVLLALLSLPAAGAAELAAQETSPGITAVRAAGPLVVDGHLDDPAWADAPALEGFVQREPTEGRPVSERTVVRVTYDEEALYIGAWLYDSAPERIVVGQNLRDASLQDSDAFLVALDPYLDRQNGFVFGTSPAGIEYDGQVAGEGQGGGPGGGRQQGGSGAGFNLNWDGSWTVSASRDGEGWYAEMRIPFATLRYPEGGTQQWGLNVERRIRRLNEQAVWAAVPREFPVYRFSLAGTMELEAPARRVVTVTPYMLAEGFKDYTVPSPDLDVSQQVGGDAKVGLTQNLTLDLTVNTDFAQAEVDDQQVNLTRFSLFFPEKRSFFLENAGVFAVGASRSAELFFSRRLGIAGGREVPIRAGARLTGRAAGLQVGLLSLQTGDLTERDPESGARIELSPANNFSVVRAYREFGGRTRLGGIAVARFNTSDTDDHNLTFGVDGRLGIGQALTMEGWAGLTSTPEVSSGYRAGSGFNDGEYGLAASASYVTGDWQATFGYRQVGDAFNPEVGFVNRGDYRHVNTRVLRHIRTPGVSWFREFRPHVSWNQFWSLDGFSESYLVHMDNHFAFENGAFFQLPGLNFTGEGLEEPFEIREGIVIPPGQYDNIDWEFRANTNRGAPLSVSAGWDLGGFYSGSRFAPTATIAYRNGDRFTLSLRGTHFDVRLAEGDFRTAVYALNLSWSFTPRVYVQSNIQLNNDTKDAFTNLRFGWLDDAGTGLFIVYDDTRHRGSLARTGFAAGPRQRRLVVKYSRLFELTR